MFEFYMPAGFLGTRADLLFDFIVVTLVAIIGILLYAIRQARMKRYRIHRALMLMTMFVLALVLVFFEIDLRMSGGYRVLFQQSKLSGTTAMTAAIYIHLVLAVSTVVVWVTHATMSLRKHPTLLPGSFSQTHRVMGGVVFYGFLSVVVTALVVYMIGFVL